jgi:hypothetical protein
VAGGADDADRLTRHDVLADCDRWMAELVAVAGDDVAGVGNPRVPAFSALDLEVYWLGVVRVAGHRPVSWLVCRTGLWPSLVGERPWYEIESHAPQ